jgi:hypothetical protein
MHKENINRVCELANSVFKEKRPPFVVLYSFREDLFDFLFVK